MKEDADIFSAYMCDFVSKTVRSGKFPSILRHVKITPSQKGLTNLKKTITLLLFY